MHYLLINSHFKERLNDHHNVVVYKASDVNFTYPSTCGVNTKLSRLQVTSMITEPCIFTIIRNQQKTLDALLLLGTI